MNRDFLHFFTFTASFLVVSAVRMFLRLNVQPSGDAAVLKVVGNSSAANTVIGNEFAKLDAA